MDVRKRMKLSLSLRSLFLYSFLLLLAFLSYRLLLVFPCSISTTTCTRSAFPEELHIQARVLLPDFLLVLVVVHDHNSPKYDPFQIHCVFHHLAFLTTYSSPAIDVDDYDEFRWMVRCPLPPLNHSSMVALQWRHTGSLPTPGGAGAGVVPAWDHVAYEALLLDDNPATALVFVKGLILRRSTEFDPTQLRCRFELVGEYPNVITTTAVGAAQEIVRCPLPLISDPPVELLLKVAVERTATGQVLPSVATILYHGGSVQEEVPANKYQLCGCTMVWNQASVLREWVVYHGWMGMQRWFIYDNNSIDRLRSEVETLNSEGYNITRHPWPWVKTQEAGFSHCLLRAKKECSWVAFFDVDEFYYFLPSRGRPSSLGEVVAEYSGVNIGEIRTKCHSFGPSGLTTHPPCGVTVGYTCRVKRTERHKSIVRPEAVDDSLANAVHHFKLREGFTSRTIPESRVLINHYKYQVWDAFKAKFSRRVSTYVADWQDEHHDGSRDRAPGLGKQAVEPLDWKQRFCEVWDTGLRDFVVANLADRHTGLLPWEISVSL